MCNNFQHAWVVFSPKRQVSWWFFCPTIWNTIYMLLDKFLNVQSFPNPQLPGHQKFAKTKNPQETTRLRSHHGTFLSFFLPGNPMRKTLKGALLWREMIRNNHDICWFSLMAPQKLESHFSTCFGQKPKASFTLGTRSFHRSCRIISPMRQRGCFNMASTHLLTSSCCVRNQTGSIVERPGKRSKQGTPADKIRSELTPRFLKSSSIWRWFCTYGHLETSEIVDPTAFSLW